VAKLESPEYAAVIEWDPTASADVVSCAVPPLSATVPTDVAPSKNCAVPVAADGVTVAVKVTLCPYVEGFGEDANRVVVAVLVDPHVGNLKEATCVLQATPPGLLGRKYSSVYQNVQSSLGSSDRLV
jgi:hypothetical protein